MDDITTIFLSIIFALLIIFAIKRWREISPDNEGWFPTTTYVNTPRITGVYPMSPNNWWGGNYYTRLNWRPWGYHHPGFYRRRGPILDAIRSPYIKYSALPYSNPIVPYGNPVPLDSIRWRGMFGPMLTSIKSPKEYALGEWVRAGSAYTDNPNDFTFVDVFQLNLDPGRDLFSYSVRTKAGQIIPINLQPNHRRLEDGDRFQIQGMEGKGDFVFSEADKYSYVYT